MSVETNIGGGFYIGHGSCFTINSHATIGRNCSIHKGALIGRENRGKRKGAPTIGNEVWIGINAVIVGNVHIGNDVLMLFTPILIAKLTVNFQIHGKMTEI